MSVGIIGKKLGMTRVFDEEGNSIPVTVVEVSENVYVQVKTTEKDGYAAVQVGYDEQKPARINLPNLGHLRRWNAPPRRKLKEIRMEKGDGELPDPAGDPPGVEIFQEGQWIDVIGTSKGKGFQGVVKRWGFGGLPATHGSMMHRRPGGVGAGTDPGRIWKNKKMPGRQGGDRVTVQNLKVVKIRPDDNVLLLSGAVPGPRGGFVLVRPAKKKPAPAKGEKKAAGEKK